MHVTSGVTTSASRLMEWSPIQLPWQPLTCVTHRVGGRILTWWQAPKPYIWTVRNAILRLYCLTFHLHPVSFPWLPLPSFFWNTRVTHHRCCLVALLWLSTHACAFMHTRSVHSCTCVVRIRAHKKIAHDKKASFSKCRLFLKEGRRMSP